MRGRLDWMILIAVIVSGVSPAVGQDTEAQANANSARESARHELLSAGHAGMVIRETEHFIVAYNTERKVLKSLTSRLEATYRSVHRFCQFNDLAVEHISEPLQILFFETVEQYGVYAKTASFPYQGSSGFYSHSNNIAAFHNIINSPALRQINQQIEQLDDQLSTLRGRRQPNPAKIKELTLRRRRLFNIRDRHAERMNRTTVQHEAAHQVLFNLGIHRSGAQNPGWLVEGLACLFETPPSPSGSGAGTTNQMRLSDFRSCLGGGDPKERVRPDGLQAAYASGKFIPLRDLIGNARLFGDRANGHIVYRYAQAWSLVCFLQRTERERFGEYLQLIQGRNVGQQPSFDEELADFQGVFGPINEGFERRWVTFIVERLRFKPSELG